MATMSGRDTAPTGPAGIGAERPLVWIAMVMLLVAPIWTVPLPGASANVAKLILILAGLIVAFGVAVIGALARRAVDVRFPRVFLVALPLVAATLISLVRAQNVSFALASLLMILLYLGFGLLVANLARTEGNAQRILGAFVAGASLAALVAILQVLGLFTDAALSPVDRVTATFGNRNFLGSVLGLLAFPAVGLFLSLRHPALRAATWLAVVLCFFGPFLVQQTGVAIAFLVGLLFLLIAGAVFRIRLPRERFRAVAVVALAVAVGVGAGLSLWFSAPNEPVEDTPGSFVEDLWAANYGGIRSLDWLTAWTMFEQNPWTGVGLGNYKVAFLEAKTQLLSSPSGARFDRPVWRAEQAHSDYLQLLAEMGVPGALALALAFAWAALTYWRRVRSAPEGLRLDLLLLLAGMVVAAAHAVVSFPFHLPVSALAFVTLLGLSTSAPLGDEATTLFRLRGSRARAAASLSLLLVAVAAAGLARELVARVDFSLGIARMEAGAIDPAERHLARSAAFSPLATESLFWLATVELHQADASADPNSYAALLLSARDHAVAARAAYPTEEGLVMEAGVSLRLGDWSRVASAAAVLLASNPPSFFSRDARALVATADARRGEVGRAEEELRRLIADEPEYVHGYLLLGSLLRQAGEREAERDLYEQAVWTMQLGLERIDRELESAEGTKRVGLLEERERLTEDLGLMFSVLAGL